jgi:hypothetical protein
LPAVDQNEIMATKRASAQSRPVLRQLQLSHYSEKVRWALDLKRIPHIRRSLLPGLHALQARRLTGDTTTTPTGDTTTTPVFGLHLIGAWAGRPRWWSGCCCSAV